MRVLIIVCALILPCCPHALAETPALLLDAQQLNGARLARVEAELSLSRYIADSKAKLLAEGIASPLEAELAQLEVRELTSLRAAIMRYGSRLAEMSDNWQVNAPSNTSKSCDEPSGIHKQISQAHIEATGPAAAEQAEIDYLSELRTRLSDYQTGDEADANEIHLADLKLDIAQARLAMTHAAQKFDAQLALFNHTTTSHRGKHLPALLHLSWQREKALAERGALVTRLELLQTHLVRLQGIQQSGGTRPGEIQQVENQIFTHRQQLANIEMAVAQFDEEVDELTTHGQVAERAADRSLLRFGWVNRYQVDSKVGLTAEWSAVSRNTELKRIAKIDPYFSGELGLSQLYVDIATARHAVHQARSVRHQIALQLTDDYQPYQVSFRPAATEAEAEVSYAFAIHSEAVAARALAESQLNLATRRHQAVKVLYADGYAGWAEHARSRRDLTVAHANIVTAREAIQLATLELARLNSLPSTIGEQAKTAMKIN